MGNFAKYTLRECIGRGGLAEVWRVTDVDGQPFALKILSVEAAGPSHALLRHEFDLLAPLHHPNIIDVVEVVEHDGRVGLVLELCAGSLADVVRRRGPLPPRVVCSVGRQIAAALAAAHDAGIVHRDVKPANILVTTDERVKLTDFGIASLLDEPGARTEQSALWGTLPFLAPERRHGGRGTRAADVYGLASTLAWLATGRLVGDLYVKPVLDALRRELPAALVEVLERAGRYDPAERHASADDVATALTAIEQSLPAVQYTLVDEAPRSALDTRAPRETGATPNERASAPPPPATSAFVSRPTGLVTSIAAIVTLGFLAAVVLTRGGASVTSPNVAIPTETADAANAPSPSAEAAPTEADVSVEDPPLHLPDVAPCRDAFDGVRNIVRLGPRETIGVLAEDLDGDGWVDAVFTNQLDESLSIYWGGEGRLLDDPVSYPILRSNTAASAADLDGDGDLDLVTNHLDASLVVLHRNDGKRGFAEVARVSQAPPPAATTAMDWNDDGVVDLVMSLRGNGDCTGIRLGTGEPFVFGPYECIGPYTEGGRLVDRGQRRLLRFNPRGELVAHTRGVGNALSPGVPVLPSSTAFALTGDVAFADTHPSPGAELYLVAGEDTRTALLRLDSTGALCRQGPVRGIERSFPQTFADVDHDGLVDTVSLRTCSGCASNHELQLAVRE